MNEIQEKDLQKKIQKLEKDQQKLKTAIENALWMIAVEFGNVDFAKIVNREFKQDLSGE